MICKITQFIVSESIFSYLLTCLYLMREKKKAGIKPRSYCFKSDHSNH